ncbi:DUF4212 domain-containing protein [Halocatena pleomorpha]|uniref:DUF4212 domain-containing protein n=1 Tax=Halocatena pleomorpha TaxID=1785090 RepID=A0A3P3RAL3_9EURY|nr:DUF4212 domain-containing protein [Halocatena pleomorpha]RRJ30521.1 DUF4212 domain-containing protein [Halocatena pleomorpha]
MTDNTKHNTDSDDTAVETDGGVAASHEPSEYLDTEVNIFNPSTPFMRDHLRLIWGLFVVWAIVVFGPVTATYLAPDLMSSITVLGFPLHYLLTAVAAPFGALVLSGVYAYKRDALDGKYGVDHTAGEAANTEATAVDGGVEQR